MRDKNKLQGIHYNNTEYAGYQCKTRILNDKGLLYTTDAALVFEEEQEVKSMGIYYRDIFNITNIDRGGRINKRIIYIINPTIIILALFAGVHLQNDLMATFFFASFLVSSYIARYIAQYWAILRIEVYLDHLEMYKIDLKLSYKEKLADELGLTVQVCHYPSGTSKWNPIEHRLFSYISLNWAGRPLIDHETALNYIKTTTTMTGLKVDGIITEKEYQTGLKVSVEQLSTLNITFDTSIPAWNYQIKPRTCRTSNQTTKDDNFWLLKKPFPLQKLDYTCETCSKEFKNKTLSTIENHTNCECQILSNNQLKLKNKTLKLPNHLILVLAFSQILSF
ncbi:MAG: hypothetical protein HeimC2_38140 [Candidatus Heimdallarchaeota archaeon LC_2]|nr:MAG: hypothetical protein HeimC2_38140 [Candidatus Heimdallarchaeota archaeon LC_2]